MSNFSKKQNHAYVVVDFDSVNERGLKKLITALKREGFEVVDLAATNKRTRRDGVPVKSAKFMFDNGQSMTLYIGSEGDIFQMTLNTTKQPIPSVSSERELAKEMGRLMQRNQAKFDKQQARKAKKVIKDTSGKKPLTRSLAARVKEAKSALSDVTENHTALSTALSAATEQLTELEQQSEALKLQLDAEKKETKELEQLLEGGN